MDEIRKRCKRCGRELPLSEFLPCSVMPDGYLNKCRECFAIDRGMREPKEKPQKRKKARKPVIPKKRGRPPKQNIMPPLGLILEPPDGKERRDAWIEAHRQRGFTKK